MDPQDANEIEVGVSEALQRHITRKIAHQKPISKLKLKFEHHRPRILRQMIAEALGVFIYVFAGIGSRASYLLAVKNAAPSEPTIPGFESLLQGGFAFSFGIAFAIIVCASTSGGHFNPALTLCFTVWQGFPWQKAILYIFSQIFGAFLAGIFLMACYWPAIREARARDLASGTALVSSSGLASLLCPFPSPGQNNQGYLFFQEFFIDSLIALVIWSCLDPANNFVSPQSAPYTIGLAYAVAIWGFGGNTISTNMARDLGTRIVSAIFFGGKSFTYMNGYAWIAILVNVPATFFGTGVYELVLRDSLKRQTHRHRSSGKRLRRHLSKFVGDESSDEKDDEDDRDDQDAWKEDDPIDRVESDQGTLVRQSVEATDFGAGNRDLV